MSEEFYRRKGGGQADHRSPASGARQRSASTPRASRRTNPLTDPCRSRRSPFRRRSIGDESGPFVALSSGFFGPEMVAATSESPSKQFPSCRKSRARSIAPSTARPCSPLHVSPPCRGQERRLEAGRSSQAVASRARRRGGHECSQHRPCSTRRDEVPLAAPKPHGTGTIRRAPARPPPRRKVKADTSLCPPPAPRMVDESDGCAAELFGGDSHAHHASWVGRPRASTRRKAPHEEGRRLPALI